MNEAVIFKLGYEVEGSELLVRAYGRYVDGSRADLRISGTEPYFFVPAEDAESVRGHTDVVSVTPGPPDPNGKPTSRVHVRYPFSVPALRKLVPYHYEADVLYSVRTRVDYRLSHIEVPPTANGSPIPVSSLVPISASPTIPPRVLWFDIETEDQFGFSRPSRPESPVLSVGFYDSKRRAFGVIYNGPEVDPEAVRAEMNAHLPPEARVADPIRLFPLASEHDVLGGFGELLSKVEPDIVAAYNGEQYDFPYLSGRADRFLSSSPNDDIRRVRETFPGMDPSGKLDPSLYSSKGRYVVADPLAIYRKRELRQRSFSLESVATDVLGYGKLPRTTTVGELRRTNPVRFIAYNLLDVLLMERIDARLRLIDFAHRIAFLGSVEIPDILHASRVVDGLLFSTARENGPPSIAFPSSNFAPAMQKRGKGAEVLSAIPGIYEGIIPIDFAEEYPSLMQTFNIGPETRVPEGTPEAYVLPTGGWYRKNPKGVVHRALTKARAMRKAAKERVRKSAVGSEEHRDAKAESDSIKSIVNSFAGVLGSKHWRLGDVTMFEDITGMARLQLQWKKRHLEDAEWLTHVLGFPASGKVVYGDTDSCLLQLYDSGVPISDADRLHHEILPKLIPALNATYSDFVGKCGATENFTSDSVDGIYERFRILPAAGSDDGEDGGGVKKRYFGLYAYDGNRDVRGEKYESRVKYVGVEVRRRNVAPISKDVQTELIRLVLMGRPNSEKAEYLNRVRDDVLSGKLDEKLFIPTQLSVERGSYKVTPDFVRAIDHYQSLTGKVVSPGDEFKWTYTLHGVRYSKSASDDGALFGEFAIPSNITFEEARQRGFIFDIDRERCIDKMVDGPARLVAPEAEGQVSRMSDVW